MQTDTRRRMEIENTAPLVTDTNAPKAVVDKNCNATAVEQIQGMSICLNTQIICFMYKYNNVRFL